MSKIKIGNNNKIKGSHIGDVNGSLSEPNKSEKFIEKHPVLTSIFGSFMIGFILLFSFWKSIVTWLESLF